MIEGIRRVACVGSGLIGQGWAALFALNGYEVAMQDLSEEKLAEAVERVRGHVGFLVQAGLDGSTVEAMSRIETTTELSEALRDAGFVQESVYESYDVKKTLYGEMDRIAPAEVVFASSTSGLLMTEIQKAMSVHPERGIVAHP